MAFVVEDGTGLTNSNSYVSVAEFQAYWLDRGIDMTQYTIDQKQVSLVLASEHVDIFFGPLLLGYKLVTDQAMEFPRACLYDRSWVLQEGVPRKVKSAVSEYAKRHLADNVVLAPDPTSDPSGLQVQSMFKKAGPLEKRIVYTTGAPRLIPKFPKADALLKDFTWGTSGGSHRA